MNKPWDKIFAENCGSDHLRLLSIATSVALTPLSALFFVSIFAFFRRRKIFHPLFSFCFLKLLLFYYCSTSFLAFRNIVFSIYGGNYETMDRIPDFIILNCERFYMAFNFFIPPLIVIGILERICATTFSRSYERSRPWSMLGLALLSASALVYVEFSNRHAILATFSTRNIHVIFAILCTCSLVILLFVNRSKSKAGRASSAFSERYQVNENMKALRIQIPVVCLDTVIQILFLCSDIFLNVAQVLNLNYCYDDNIYLNKFAIFRFIGFLLQYFIPVNVLYHFCHFFGNSHRHRSVKRSDPISPATPSVFAIRNTFGMEMTEAEHGPDGQDAHFKHLHAQWG